MRATGPASAISVSVGVTVPNTECRIVGDQHVGDHILFLGEVERYAKRDVKPLLFVKGRFGTFADAG